MCHKYPQKLRYERSSAHLIMKFILWRKCSLDLFFFKYILLLRKRTVWSQVYPFTAAFVARCSTSTARLSRAASLSRCGCVREAEGTQPSHWLPFTSPPSRTRPRKRGEREKGGRRKERKKERMKEKHTHTHIDNKQKGDVRGRDYSSSGGCAFQLPRRCSS